MAFRFRNLSPDLHSVVIEATRVRLQAINREYEEEIYRHFTTEITTFMMPAPPADLAETRVFVENALAGLSRGDDLQLVISRKSNGEFLGLCGLHGRGKPMEPELGIWLKKSAHGNGFGLEAIAALRNWGESNIEFKHLLYPVDRRNIASKRIPEILGSRVLAECKKTSMTGVELDEIIYGIENNTLANQTQDDA